MFRFFVDKRIANEFLLSQETLHHIRVARVMNKKFICIFQQKFYVCQLKNQKAQIINVLNENHEFKEEVIVAASLIEIKKFEWLIQKATELGATKIIPVISQNVSQNLRKKIISKIVRWNKITLNAAEQSFRNVFPVITLPQPFNEVIQIKCKNKFIAHEKKTMMNIRASYESGVIFLVGPEGGFTDEEIKDAEKKHFEVVSLGPRILRSETASLFLLSRIRQS